mmetsp:Transcript_20562/g.52176  ORF Transcript_20562/g.52176 Transcript_20562/m.52176 type:complete len:215 (+) Transcript_20562:1249-1893(+)
MQVNRHLETAPEPHEVIGRPQNEELVAVSQESADLVDAARLCIAVVLIDAHFVHKAVRARDEAHGLDQRQNPAPPDQHRNECRGAGQLAVGPEWHAHARQVDTRESRHRRQHARGEAERGGERGDVHRDQRGHQVEAVEEARVLVKAPGRPAMTDEEVDARDRPRACEMLRVRLHGGRKDERAARHDGTEADAALVVQHRPDATGDEAKGVSDA